MANLTRASKELFRRTPDECIHSLPELAGACHRQKEDSSELWHSPASLTTNSGEGERLTLSTEDDRRLTLNDWSFGQLCRMAGVQKTTINRLTPGTADRVFRETLPGGAKPVQLYSEGDRLRSIHPPSYTRLHNVDLLSVVQEFAVDFQPPPPGGNGGTGLYKGEQDMFCFLIDPGGWTEIGGEAFAPGFFVWNSEVGARTVGIEAFWFQKVCQNHIVWDAIEVEQFHRKHTTNVHDALRETRRVIETLVARRDERRDGFAQVIRRAMETKLGEDADEVEGLLGEKGIQKTLARKAIEIARERGNLTVFAIVDALTRIGGSLPYAAQRTAADQQAARLLTLAA